MKILRYSKHHIRKSLHWDSTPKSGEPQLLRHSVDSCPASPLLLSFFFSLGSLTTSSSHSQSSASIQPPSIHPSSFISQASSGLTSKVYLLSLWGGGKRTKEKKLIVQTTSMCSVTFSFHLRLHCLRRILHLHSQTSRHRTWRVH